MTKLTSSALETFLVVPLFLEVLYLLVVNREKRTKPKCGDYFHY